jgi:prevent-host-death family protein
MKTLTADTARKRFGELITTMQHEPVLITKHGQPSAVFISIHDAANTLLPELLLEKLPEYDQSLRAEIERFREVNRSVA